MWAVCSNAVHPNQNDVHGSCRHAMWKKCVSVVDSWSMAHQTVMSMRVMELNGSFVYIPDYYFYVL
jgi:hypothetical protein